MENYFYTLQQIVNGDLKRDTSAVPQTETENQYMTELFGYNVRIIETHKQDFDWFEITYVHDGEIFGGGGTLDEAKLSFAYCIGLLTGRKERNTKQSIKIQKLKKKINKLKKEKKKW